MFDEHVEVQLGFGGRRVLVVPRRAVRQLSASTLGPVEIRRGYHVLVVPGSRVRSPSRAEAMELAGAVLGHGMSSHRIRQLLHRFGLGMNRALQHDEVAQALMNHFKVVHLVEDHGRWDGPTVERKSHRPAPESDVISLPALTWVAVVVVDDTTPSQPLAGAHFRLRLPDASTLAGRLDGDGHARVDDIGPGKCWLELTDLKRGSTT